MEFLKFPTHNSEELLKNSAEESRFQNTSEHPRTQNTIHEVLFGGLGGWAAASGEATENREIDRESCEESNKSINQINLIIEIKKKNTLSKTVNHVKRRTTRNT